MGTLTKEQILQADDLKKELVSVPDWGGDVYVRTMTGTERDAFEQSIIETDGENIKMNFVNIRAKLCASTIVDEEGNRLFEEKDIAELGKKSAAALNHIFTAAQKLNGISKDDIKELAKNSGKTQSEDSTSD